MPLCHTKTYCKDVVIPDKDGKPIGGITCKEICESLGEKPPPGYTPWNPAMEEPGRAPGLGVLVFTDTDTGESVALTQQELRTIIRLASRRWPGICGRAAVPPELDAHLLDLLDIIAQGAAPDVEDVARARRLRRLLRARGRGPSGWT